MRTLVATLLATSLLASNAFAAGSAVGPLAPGKPAGVRAAQQDSNLPLWVIGGGIVIGGILLVATGNNDNDGLLPGTISTGTGATTTTTTGTTTTGTSSTATSTTTTTSP